MVFDSALSTLVMQDSWLLVGEPILLWLPLKLQTDPFKRDLAGVLRATIMETGRRTEIHD